MNGNQTYTESSWFLKFSLTSGTTLLSICLLGIVGNFLSAVVFLERSFRKVSLNLLLAALSVADLGLMVLAVPVYCSGPLTTYFKTSWLGQINLVATVRLYPIAAIFQCCSIWFLILITCERWLAVCKPFMVAAYCTRTRALWGISLVCVSSILYNVVKFWDFDIDPVTNGFEFKFRANKVYSLWYATVSWLALGYILPLAVLIVMNSYVMVEIVRANRYRRSMSAKERETSTISRMLLYVVLVFVCCYTLSFVLSLVEMLHPELFQSEIGFVLSDLTNMLGLLNSATSALFYLRFSSRYRRGMRQLLTQMPLTVSTSVFSRMSSFPAFVRRSMRSDESIQHRLTIVEEKMYGSFEMKLTVIPEEGKIRRFSSTSV